MTLKAAGGMGKNVHLNGYIVACGVGLIVMILLAAIAEIPALQAVSYGFEPGMLFGALFFPGGVHSSSGAMYIVVSL